MWPSLFGPYNKVYENMWRNEKEKWGKGHFCMEDNGF